MRPGTTLAGFILLALAGLWVFRDALGAPLAYPAPGTGDFIEYWAAFQLFLAGENPYDGGLLLEVERTLGWSQDTALMMWNPPWLLVLLAPVLALDFPMSARVWGLLTPVLLVATVALVVSAMTTTEKLNRRAFYGIAVATVAFFPVLNSAILGQLGVFLCFGTALLFRSCVRGHDLGIALALVLLSTKPHLFLLLGVAILFWVLATRRTAVLYYSLLFLGLAVLLTLVVNSGVVAHWYAGVSGSTASDATIPAGSWAGSTLVGAARSFLGSLGVADSRWVMAVVPSVAILGLAGWLIRSGGPEPWERTFPALLCISVWTSSFGWLFDHSVLLLVQLCIVGGVLRDGFPRSGRVALLGLLVLIQAAVPVMIGAGFRGYQHYWWLPGALLGAYLLYLRVEGGAAAASRWDGAVRP